MLQKFYLILEIGMVPLMYILVMVSNDSKPLWSSPKWDFTGDNKESLNNTEVTSCCFTPDYKLSSPVNCDPPNRLYGGRSNSIPNHRPVGLSSIPVNMADDEHRSFGSKSNSNLLQFTLSNWHFQIQLIGELFCVQIVFCTWNLQLRISDTVWNARILLQERHKWKLLK